MKYANYRGSPDPQDEHCHVGPQPDDDGRGIVSGCAVTVCGGLGGFYLCVLGVKRLSYKAV